MKTSLFYDNYDAIKLFCKQAKEGLVVVETNSEITKDEFVELLNSDFKIYKTKLKNFVEQNVEFENDGVVLVDEFDTINSSKIVVDLNYNRNWFLQLHRNIIFILRPSTVNKLIKYSASFWSFVTLHKVFSCQFRSIIQPHFIRSINDCYSVNQVKYDTYYGDIKSRENKFSAIAWDYLHIICGRETFINCLEQKVLELDKTDNQEIAGLISKTLSFVEELSKYGFTREAKRCLTFIDKSFFIHKDYIELEIKKLNAMAEIDYSLEFYDSALTIYEKLYNVIMENRRICNGLSISSLLNNVGVVYYKKESYSESLDCFYKAVEILNESNETFVFVNLLFNLSLLHYQINDLYNASYYIDSALERINETDGDTQCVLLSKCKVLKAYLVINLGDLNFAQELLNQSLSLLREKIDEKSTFLMEVYYVFAVLYLHKKQLDHAENYAIKAYLIMRSIDCSISIRCYIRELLGEIYFYKKDYNKAKAFLKVAYSHNCDRKVFSPEISRWIKATLEYCEQIT